MYSLDLVGKKFHSLTVVGEAPKRHPKRRNWLCRCDCGTEIEVDTGRLRSKNTKSCGCLRRKICSDLGKSGSGPKLPPGEAGYRALRRKYINAAEDRGHEFHLSDAEFRQLTSQNCHYCNKAPSQIQFASGRNEVVQQHTAYTYNGIDRKDPTLGYFAENCVTACSDCNLAKQSLSYAEFLDLVQRIYKNRFKG